MKPHILTAYIVVVAGLLSTCNKTSNPDSEEPCIIQTDSVAIASKLLTLSDAEKIMGEPATLTCNTFLKKSDTLEYKCYYTAVSQDTVTDKTGKLYFMYEEYAGVAGAQNAYATIYQANQGHAGVEIIHGLGDEAYYHSDLTGFYFLMVRKGENIFRLKLNKVTSNSSEANFKDAAKLIVDRI